MARVFVSHSTHDRDFIEREIIEPLARHGMEFWYARTSIEAAAQWERSILKGLKECDWFLVVLSPRSAQSRWVKHEFDWAFQRKTGRIIPVLLEDCDPDDFHIGVAGLQYIDFRADLHEARHKLVRAFGQAETGGPVQEIAPEPAPHTRRLPIYFLIDCSMSLAGEPMEAIRMGLRALMANLQSDPHALETVWVSLITFGSRARQAVPLTDILSFRMPDLQADTRLGIDLGGALRCFLDAVQRELVPTTWERKGDFMPLPVIMVSQPSTTPLAMCARMLQAAREWVLPPVIFALDSGTDMEQLKRLSDYVFHVHNLTPNTLAHLFKWVSPPVME